MSDLFTPTIARTSSSDTGNNVGYLKDSSADKLTLTMEDFLQLMIAQFQNQDIDNPASTSDMMNQLISMSTIQSMKTMTDAATMSYAASLDWQNGYDRRIYQRQRIEGNCRPSDRYRNV